MVDRDRPRYGELAPEHRAAAELHASRRELSTALTTQVDFLVKQLNTTPEEAAAWVRSAEGIQPEDQEPDQVAWYALAKLLEADPERGEALWRRIKRQAGEEQDTGIRSSLTIERQASSSPMDRARHIVVLTALREALGPKDGLEELLVQQMACAYELHLRWQERAAQRAQEEEWEGDRDRRREWERLSPAQQERYALDHGWMPPRVSTAEAIDQAVLIADRFQRSFLRIMKAYRDNRRLFGTLVVAGNQINIAADQSGGG